MSKNCKHPFKIGNKTGMPTFTSLIQHSTGSPSHSNQIRKKVKGIQIGKEEVKLSVFADDNVQVENPKESTKKLLELPWLVWLSGLSASL